MKTPHFIIILFLFAFSLNASKAQTPGYLGKKITVQLDLAASPAITGPTYNNSQGLLGEGDILYGFNFFKGASASYALSRNTSIGLKYRNARSRIILHDEITSGSYSKYITYNYALQANQICLSLTKFKLDKGGLAPLGAYTNYDIGMLMLSSQDSAKLIDPIKSTHMTLGIGFGKKTIITDRLFIDRCFDFSVVVNGGYLVNVDDISDADRAENPALYRFRRSMLFNFRLGLGYIL
jgi:hypothetical protein